jgi:hypothetical protein
MTGSGHRTTLLDQAVYQSGQGWPAPVASRLVETNGTRRDERDHAWTSSLSGAHGGTRWSAATQPGPQFLADLLEAATREIALAKHDDVPSE